MSAPITMGHYKYRPLETATCIRWIHLEPAANYHDELRCSLIYSDIDSCPDYAAISYVWGDPENVDVILCDGLTLGISRNLLSALRGLRDKETALSLWADAICINQNDISERGNQVLIMDKIYSHATKVLAWFGEPTFEYLDLFRRLEELDARLIQSGLDWFPGELKSLAKAVKISHEIAIGRNSDFDLHDLKCEQKALECLINVDWFSRTWTFQEALLAKKIQLYFGDQSMDFWTLISLFKRLHIGLTRGFSLPNLDKLAGIASLNQARDISTRDFSILLIVTRHRNCTDPRDKIYALLGLLNDDERSVVLPDYSADVDDLYTKVARHILKKSQSYSLFSCLESADLKSKSLPSWVPDWRVAMPFNPLLTGFYSADNSRKFAVKFSDNTAIFTGKLLDTIVEICRVKKIDPSCWAREGWENHKLRYQRYLDYLTACENLGSKARDPYSGEMSPHEWLPQILIGQYDMIQQTKASIETARSYFEAAVQLKSEWNSRLQSNTLTSEFLSLTLGKQDGRARIFDMTFNACLGLYWSTGTSLRSFALTSAGLLGWVPSNSEPGDMVAVFGGAEFPQALRPTRSGHYQILGRCFVPGLMEGQASEMTQIPWETITLI
jgi:hypothetical protein